MLYGVTLDTPIGSIEIIENDGSLIRLTFGADSFPSGTEKRATPFLDHAAMELREYFAGERRAFDVSIAPVGTTFQQTVWSALSAIPYGETRSYGEIAKYIGAEKASRAVGMANNRNPIPIIIPCHRVIGANGALTGYAGGLEIKRALIALEAKASLPEQTKLRLFP